MVLFWPALLKAMQGMMMKTAMSGTAGAAGGGALGGAMGGAAKGAMGAGGAASAPGAGAALGGGGGAAAGGASPPGGAAPAAAPVAQMVQVPGPQQGLNQAQMSALGADRSAGSVAAQPNFAGELIRGYMDNYMASQGIDMSGGFKEGLKGYAEKQGLGGGEKQPTFMAKAEAPTAGKLSDFIGTIQTGEKRKRQGLPF